MKRKAQIRFGKFDSKLTEIHRTFFFFEGSMEVETGEVNVLKELSLFGRAEFFNGKLLECQSLP